MCIKYRIPVSNWKLQAIFWVRDDFYSMKGGVRLYIHQGWCETVHHITIHSGGVVWDFARITILLCRVGAAWHHITIHIPKQDKTSCVPNTVVFCSWESWIVLEWLHQGCDGDLSADFFQFSPGRFTCPNSLTKVLQNRLFCVYLMPRCVFGAAISVALSLCTGQFRCSLWKSLLCVEAWCVLRSLLCIVCSTL